MSNESIGKNAAETLRRELSLGLSPIQNIARLIEKELGIDVAFVSTAPPGHGMTMRLGERYMIAAGCTEHPMRLRSTLAHEIGHLRIGSVNCKLDYSDWTVRTPEEIQADAFARHLLVPLDALDPSSHEQSDLKPLSDLVQQFMASPAIVAIQLRNIGAITQETCTIWQKITSGHLAAQFGWKTEYQALVVQSTSARAPQALMARAIEGYRWRLMSPAAISRLDGGKSPQEIIDQLQADEVVQVDSLNEPLERPRIVQPGLTAEELRFLSGDAG